MFISMKFCCASNAAIKIVKIAPTKINIFQKKMYPRKSKFSKKVQNCLENNIYFRTQAVVPIILTTYLPV